MGNNCKKLKVTVCNKLTVEGMDTLIDAVNAVNATLTGEVVVAPNDQWASLLQSAFEAADLSVTIDGQPISVTVDTTEGPVTVTGTVSIDGEVTIANFPTSFSIDNFAELADVELTVTLDGEVVTVTPDEAFLEAFNNITDAINATVRVEYEATGMCVVDANGNELNPCVKQYTERKYTNGGVFISETIVLSQFLPDGTVTGYTLGKGEQVVKCKTKLPCVLLGTLNKYVEGELGLFEEHWAEDDAVPHDDISVTFPNNTHPTATPTFTQDIRTTFVANDVVITTVGTSQSYYKAYIDVLQDNALISEDNPNVGERIRLDINGVTVAEVAGSDTNTAQVGATSAPIPIAKGIGQLVEVYVSDFSAAGGVTLRISYDGGETFTPLPAYKTPSKYECVKVEKCDGQLFNAVTNELVVITENDAWLDCEQLSKLCAIEDLLSSVIGGPDDECGCDDDCSQYDATYQLAGTETAISFGSNDTTVKWENQGNNAEANAFTQAIMDCVDNGGVASITYSDGGVDTHTFDVTSYTGTADGVSAFTGTATGTTGSGKLDNASTTCKCE